MLGLLVDHRQEHRSFVYKWRRILKSAVDVWFVGGHQSETIVGLLIRNHSYQHIAKPEARLIVFQSNLVNW